MAFDTIVVEGEALDVIAPPSGPASQLRTRDNPERTTAAPGFDAFGLRTGYVGEGYIDFNGGPGAKASFEIGAAEIPAGDYQLTLRGAAFGDRFIEILVNGQAQGAAQNFNTSGWALWDLRTFNLTIPDTADPIIITIVQTGATGPNIDAVALHEVGVPVTFDGSAADTSADADATPLDLTGPVGSIAGAQAQSINLNLRGIDADVVRVEISFDGGATRQDVTALPDSDGDFVVDGSALPFGATTATVFVTDASGNEALAQAGFIIAAPQFNTITLQAEDATLTDLGDPGTGPDGRAQMRVVDADTPDAFGNFQQGAQGGAYVDFGEDAGDALGFSVDVPVAGTYLATIRYANGAGAARPLELSVNGAAQTSVPFTPTPLEGGNGWENWTDIEVELQLVAGVNTLNLAIAEGSSTGPNIDQITIATTQDTPADAQRFVDVIKVNFEPPAAGNGAFNAPQGYQTPAGFEADTGAAYGARGNGFTYGWVDVSDANGTVTNTPLAQPVSALRYRNDASDASDLQKTYAHFDLPGGTGDRARAWEIALANGTYELTVALGDTAGQYDSNYVLNAEGRQFGAAWVPVNLAREALTGASYNASFDGVGFRSNLSTGIVQVEDGRLTLDGIDGQNVEIQWLDIQRIPDLTPGDGRSADLDYSRFVDARAASTEAGQVSIEIAGNGAVPLNIDPTSDIVIGIELQAQDHRGPAVAFTEGVRLVETLTGIEVPVNVQVTGGADSMTIRPLEDLREFTSYTFTVEDVLDLGNLFDGDQPLRQFQDYTTTFVTGETPDIVARDVAFSDQVVLNGFSDGGVAITSIDIGPDGRLYASSILGQITRWDLNADGTLDKASAETLAPDYFSDTGRSIIGMVFDPTDPNVIWVSDNAPVPRQGKADETPEFSGQISKITLGTGGDFETATVETYITGLPRSGGDHVTNSLEFRANPDAGVNGEPEYLLYFTQGSNSAAGAADPAWGFRPERLLNAAVLEVDPTRDAPDGGFDVQTEPYDPNSNVPTFRTPDAFNEDGTFPGLYSPFAQDAVLRIFGEGVRNAYDLVWHSNGRLYVPTNGTAAGGYSPDDPQTAIDEGIGGDGGPAHRTQFDYLFTVEEGGYYGHPNPLLGNYVLNGGNPTDEFDFGGENTGRYAVGVQPDADYDTDGVYSLGFNKSPNGATEYTGNAFGANLQGAVLFAQFSQGDNVRVINIDPDTGEITGDDVLRRADGSEINEYIDPLDIIENPLTGQLYLSTLNRGSGESLIVLLNPTPGDAPAVSFIDAVDFTILDTDSGTIARLLDDPATHEPGSGNDANGDGLNDNFDGRGYLDPNGGAEDKASFTYFANVAGDYTLTFRMASANDRSLLVKADGQSQTVAVNTGSFATWQDFDVDFTLRAGANTIILEQPGGAAPNIDSVTITAPPDETGGNANADIAVQSLDAGYFADRLHFSFLENNAEGGDSPRDFKDRASVEISNTGSEDLEFFGVDITGPFNLAVPDQLEDLVLAAGQSIVVEVLFDGNAVRPRPGDDVNGVQEGVLSLFTNDAEDPITTVDLAGFWQLRNEGRQEPNLNEIWQVFGFGNFIEGLAFEGGGEGSVLNLFDLYLPADETEVLSPYWRIADGATQATFTQIAAFHGAGGAPAGIHGPGNKSAGNQIQFGVHDGRANQTLLPTENGAFFTETITADDIPDNWRGNGVFGIEIANLSTDPTLNGSGNGVIRQGRLDREFPGQGYTVVDGVVFDPQGNEVPDGYTVRAFQAVDRDGTPIENVFLFAQDYTGINYDYQDNVFLVQGITPVSGGSNIVVSNLDDAAADDRLVFTNIEQPANNQQFRNEASFTLSNPGLAAVAIGSVTITGESADAFEIIGATPTSIAAGGSVDVTVRFVGIDGVDDNAAVLHEAVVSVQTPGQVNDIALSGLAQLQSQRGEEPNVAQIVEAFGYSTDVAQDQLNNGGDVETVGDEVLLPYLQRLDASRPVEVINLAAFLQQGDISRINIHDPGSNQLTELFAGDDNQGQTVLPDGLVVGAGDTGVVGRAEIDSDDPFGIKVTVDGRPRFAAWTDPEINRIDAELRVNNEGHYIRFFEARDAQGATISGTYIGLQDYPGGANFDYNDSMFLLRNVQGYTLTPADDANGNGVHDALETDSDADGLVDFFDDQSTAQAPFGGTAPVLTDSLTLAATAYDTGGQGIAYNDAPGLSGGTDGGRTGSDVEVTDDGAIGWVANGEWLEYTISVPTAGTYSAELLMSFGGQGARSATVDVFAPGSDTPYATTGPVANAPTGGWSAFLNREAGDLDLEAGTQIVRVTFEGGSQNLQSLSLTQTQAPQAIGEAGTLSFTQSTADQWFTVTFAQALDDPSVVMGPLSFTGPEAGDLRIRNVTDQGFEFQLDEWDYLDGSHTAETVSWVAVESGVHSVNGLTVAAGLGSASADRSSISFAGAFDEAPVVLAQVSSVNDGGPVTERLDDITATGFDVELHSQESDQGTHGAETLSWIAFEAGGQAGSGLLAGTTGNTVTHLGTDIGFDGSFGNDSFVFVADIQTEDGPDTATLRVTELTNTSASLFIQEETSQDAETIHTTEDVGFAALTEGVFFADIA